MMPQGAGGCQYLPARLLGGHGGVTIGKRGWLLNCLQLAASRLPAPQRSNYQEIDCVACLACRVQTHEPGLRKRGQQHNTLGAFQTDQPILRCASVGVHAEKRPRPYPAMSTTLA